MTVIADVEIGVADAEKALTTIESDYTTAKAKVVSVLQAHVATNAAVVAAHQAEVDAANALIAKAVPTATAKATNAAAIILTASPQVQGVIGFLGKNWRYVVAGVAVLIIGYGAYAGLVHI